jgi:hypothetical protein
LKGIQGRQLVYTARIDIEALIPVVNILIWASRLRLHSTRELIVGYSGLHLDEVQGRRF